MFCDRCGTPMLETHRFCGSCGKVLHPIPSRPATGRIEGHVRTLAIFWLVYSAIHMMGGFWLSAAMAQFGSFWFPHPHFFFPGMMRGAGMMLGASGILGLIAGWGLLNRQPWARTLAIVLGFFALFHFGVGTALGIYTLWVLLPAESAQEYQRTARAF